MVQNRLAIHRLLVLACSVQTATALPASQPNAANATPAQPEQDAPDPTATEAPSPVLALRIIIEGDIDSVELARRVGRAVDRFTSRGGTAERVLVIERSRGAWRADALHALRERLEAARVPWFVLLDTTGGLDIASTALALHAQGAAWFGEGGIDAHRNDQLPTVFPTQTSADPLAVLPPMLLNPDRPRWIVHTRVRDRAALVDSQDAYRRAVEAGLDPEPISGGGRVTVSPQTLAFVGLHRPARTAGQLLLAFDRVPRRFETVRVSSGLPEARERIKTLLSEAEARRRAAETAPRQDRAADGVAPATHRKAADQGLAHLGVAERALAAVGALLRTYPELEGQSRRSNGAERGNPGESPRNRADALRSQVEATRARLRQYRDRQGGS